MEPVKANTDEFQCLEAYARDTHGSTHRHYSVNVLNAFRVERSASIGLKLPLDLLINPSCRQGETNAWLNSSYDKLDDGDRLLLWHGSRTTNFAGLLAVDSQVAAVHSITIGILKQGLRIAPPEGMCVYRVRDEFPDVMSLL
jgi:poly [ADP-ribose] polymerase